MNIVVLAGGLSTERDVSFKTGSMVAKALKENGHKVILLDVFMGYSDRTKFRNKYLKPLLDEGKIEMTNPEHPRSSIQKYKTV